MSQKIIDLGGKPSLDNENQKNLIKDLTKQLEVLSVESVSKDKSKNIIKDQTINGTKLRLQKVIDLPSKDLRKLVDSGKKEIGEGVVVVCTIKEGKIGLAVGVTNKLVKKYNAVEIVKAASIEVGGKGGGGRTDFAQAGGDDSSKVDDAFEKIKTLI